MSEETGRLDSLLHGARIGKFVSVGFLGTAVDLTVFMTLSEAGLLPPEIATLVGIESAILVMFAANEHWTFASEGGTGRWTLLRRCGRSHAVRAAGSLTQFTVFLAVLWSFDVQLSLYGVGLWKLVAKLAGIGVGMGVNYVFESLFTWRVHRDDGR